MSEYDRKYYTENREIKRAKWDAWARTLKGQFNVSKRKALSDKKEWTITLEEFGKLRDKPCYYCGGKLPETSRGLDRVDNSKGYTLDNVLPCCGGCNTLRSDVLSVEETKEVVKLLKQLRSKEDLWQ